MKFAKTLWLSEWCDAVARPSAHLNTEFNIREKHLHNLQTHI